MNKVTAIFGVLRFGEQLSNPATWKNASAATMVVTAVLWALVNVFKVFQLPFDVTPEQVDQAAVVIVTVVGLYFNYATSAKVGLLPAKKDPE